MSKKVFIAEQETLLEVQEQVEKLVRNLVPDDAPIYGMVIHEASDLNPSTRVEYLGANKGLYAYEHEHEHARHELWIMGWLGLAES